MVASSLAKAKRGPRMTGSETKIRKRWLKTNSDWLEAGPPQTFKRRHMQFLLFLLYLINKVCTNNYSCNLLNNLVSSLNNLQSSQCKL